MLSAIVGVVIFIGGYCFRMYTEKPIATGNKFDSKYRDKKSGLLKPIRIKDIANGGDDN